MARIHDLIRQVAQVNSILAEDLRKETEALTDRRAFGLNFERHTPEAVELPGRPIRRNDKVRVLPPRGSSATQENRKLWRVAAIKRAGEGRVAELESLTDEAEKSEAPVEDLVVVAEFRDPIYPGLVSTGKVERGGDKPFHTVINAENFHALQTLLFTHRGKVDAIYIDPPYNTGARDWKYNNDYVDNNDNYRHSKWLAFMERRLMLAKRLLNPEASGLILTIDEKEVHRVGLLLAQIFPSARVQMVSSVINPKGVVRDNEFSRSDEYLFFVLLGNMRLVPEGDAAEAGGPVPWQQLRRTDIESARGTKKGGRGQFFPVYVNTETFRIEAIGNAIPPEMDRHTVEPRLGCATVFPVRDDGTEMNWGLTAPSLEVLLKRGFVRATKFSPEKPQVFTLQYLTSGRIADIDQGEAEVLGYEASGAAIVRYKAGVSQRKMATTNWNRPAHNSQYYGRGLVEALLPGRVFPFPKSLYAVEDALRFLVAENAEALVLDFFAGSGTTAHAVMRLNRQDGGQRSSILITNNEIGPESESELTRRGIAAGDSEWERLGIFEHITKPRLEAAVSGIAANGAHVAGEYKFVDEFPMAEGFEENVEFFTLTYEAPLRVSSNREFEKIAPLLWLRAGSLGRRIEDLANGWDVADAYGVIADFDEADEFVSRVKSAPGIRMVFVVTDEDRVFESMVRDLPDHVEPVRLYESYLRNFEIEAGRPL